MKRIGLEPLTGAQKTARYRAKNRDLLNARKRTIRTGSPDRLRCGVCGKTLRSDNGHDLCAACWKGSAGEMEEQFEYTRSDHARDLYYQRNYGITLEEYNAILEYQGYRCAVCKRHVSELSSSLCVDHDHKHKRVRGLICHYCNRKVVGWHSDAVLLQAAVDYILNPPFTAVYGDREMPKKRKKRKPAAKLKVTQGAPIGSTTRTVRRRTTGR